jgi:chromosome segregation ATPase
VLIARIAYLETELARWQGTHHGWECELNRVKAERENLRTLLDEANGSKVVLCDELVSMCDKLTAARSECDLLRRDDVTLVFDLNAECARLREALQAAKARLEMVIAAVELEPQMCAMLGETIENCKIAASGKTEVDSCAEPEPCVAYLANKELEAESARLKQVLEAILSTATSVPAPYIGNAMDPVNDLRIVSGRKIEAARQLMATQPKTGGSGE